MEVNVTIDNIAPDIMSQFIFGNNENYKTHSILKRCFPPMPDKCLFCHKEGDDLYREPCRVTT